MYFAQSKPMQSGCISRYWQKWNVKTSGVYAICVLVVGTSHAGLLDGVQFFKWWTIPGQVH